VYARHDSKVQDIQDLGSDGSQLPATVHLTFVREGRTYGIKKSFLRSPAATLMEDGREIARGKQADDYCRRGRDIVVKGFDDIPRAHLAPPRAAFYAFFRIDGVTDSFEFAKHLVRTIGIGLAPGVAFGPGGKAGSVYALRALSLQLNARSTDYSRRCGKLEAI
jgi:hypothetical protein